jgi:hypothetical protein
MEKSGGPSGMECRQIADLLTDYFEDALPPHVRDLLEWHIEGCPPCVAFLKTFRGTLDAVRQLPETPIPPELKTRLLAVLRAREARGERGRT